MRPSHFVCRMWMRSWIADPQIDLRNHRNRLRFQPTDATHWLKRSKSDPCGQTAAIEADTGQVKNAPLHFQVLD